MIQRRDFLRTGTLGAVSATPAVHAFGTPSHRADERIAYALIGAGTQGRILLNAAASLPDVECLAICDIWPYAQNYAKSFLGRHGQKVNIYEDYHDLFESESLDAVLIATPDFCHGPQVAAALASNCHVYCEPMLAHSMSDCMNLVQRARQSDRQIQIGFQRRSDPRYRFVKERLLDELNLIDHLVAAQTQWALPYGTPRGWPRRFTLGNDLLQRYGYRSMHEFRNWFWFSKYASGPYGRFVTQQLDVCQWFLNASPRSVLASGGGQFYPDLPGLDTILAVYEYPVDDKILRASSQLFTASSGGGTLHFERFLGTAGSLQMSQNGRWTEIAREADAPRDWEDLVRKHYLVKPRVAAVHEAQDDEVDVHVSGEVERYLLPALDRQPECGPHLANFFESIRGKEPLNCPLTSTWASHLAVFKTLEAVQKQSRVTLDAKLADR